MGVVKVQSEKKHARVQTWFTREAKEIEGICTQADRITIRISQMYSYIIDNFRMCLTFIVSFG